MSNEFLALLAGFPIIIIFILMVGFRWPAAKAMPLAFVVVFLLVVLVRETPLNRVLASSFGYRSHLFYGQCHYGASCAFMLPVATPPDAMVFSSGKLEKDMVRTRIWTNLISIALVSVLVYFVPPLFEGFNKF